MSTTLGGLDVARSLAESEVPIGGFADLLINVGWPEKRISALSSDIKVLEVGGSRPVSISTRAQGVDALAEGYSSESGLSLFVANEHRRIRLVDTLSSGAKSIAEADAESPREIFELARFVVATAVEVLPRQKHVRLALPHALGQSLATMRTRLADSAHNAGHDPAVRDFEFLQLFHRLFFIKVTEDRRRSGRLEACFEQPDVVLALGELVDEYTEVFDSRFFERPAMAVFDVPDQALKDLLTSWVRPYEGFQTNLSLARHDLAGRLYQAYLSDVPQMIQAEGQLHALAQSVDERKRNGSYYTPQSLAVRLTEETLGGWLAENEPQVPESVTVLDPACGSGAFLAAAFELLIEHFAAEDDEELRRRILLRSLRGVDIDEAAVLLAKAHLLEVGRFSSKLPELEDTIVVGDSIDNFDWKSLSNRIDVVLVNPPFISQNQRAHYLKEARGRYPEVSAWGIDVADLFVAETLRILDTDGFAGLVLPQSSLGGQAGASVRELVLSKRPVLSMTDFESVQMFDAAAYVTSVVLGASGSQVATCAVARPSDPFLPAELLLDEALAEATRSDAPMIRTQVSLDVLDSSSWSVGKLLLDIEIEQMKSSGPLSEFVDVLHGTQTGDNDRFVYDEPIHVDETSIVAHVAKIDERVEIPRSLVFRVARPRAFSPFHLSSNEWVFVPQHDDLASDSIVEQLGGVPTNRQRGQTDRLQGKKVLIPSVGQRFPAVADAEGEWMPLKGTGGAVALVPTHPRLTLRRLELILNTPTYQRLLLTVGTPKKGGAAQLFVGQLEGLPFPELADELLQGLDHCARAIASSRRRPRDRESLKKFADAMTDADCYIMNALGIKRATSSSEADRVG